MAASTEALAAAALPGDLPAGPASEVSEAEREGQRRRRRRGGRGRGERDESRAETPEGVEAAEADPLPLDESTAGATAPAEPTDADGDSQRGRRGGRGRGRRERTEGDAPPAADGYAASAAAEGVMAPLAAAAGDASSKPWWETTEPAAEAVAHAPAAQADAEPPVAIEPVASTATDDAPMAALADEAPPPVAPPVLEAPTRAPEPARAATPAAATRYELPIDDLAAIAQGAGLQWVNSDAERVRAVQAAMAAAPQPAHVPREPKPAVEIDDGPLVLVETQKDLSAMKLPFETRST